MDARQRQILDYLFNNSKSSHAQELANVDSQPTEPIQSEPPTKEGITFDVTTFNLLPDSVKQSVNMVQTLAQEFSYGYR